MDLPIDIIQNDIGKYFTPLDIYKLAIIMPQFRNIYFASLVKRLIIKEITNRLKFMMGSKYGEFVKIMKESYGFISGSFIIQCILNEKWDDDKIEIFIPFIGNTNMTQWKCGYLKSNLNIFIEKELGVRSILHLNCQLNNKIKDIRVLDKFKIISAEYDDNINIDSMKKIINDTFDFDISKNFYCFNNEDDIYIHNINNILTKNTKFSCNELWTSSILSYMKYSDRGFKFNNIKSLTYSEIKPFIFDKKIKVFRMKDTPSNIYYEKFFGEEFFNLPISNTKKLFYCFDLCSFNDLNCRHYHDSDDNILLYCD